MKKIRGILVFLVLFLPSQARSDALETYGDIAQLAIPGFALAASVVKKDYEGVVQLGLTSGVTLGTTFALKYGVDRERPDGGGQSFPSGHTASAFMGASYLHYRYGWQYGFPAYAAATVSIERLRGGETLVRELHFETKEDEYNYEVGRNDTHRMLVDILAKEKIGDNPGVLKMVDMFMDKAAKTRTLAEQQAAGGDFDNAVETMELATKEILRAIRSAGIYIPE